jgi:hypothetical protein
MALDLLESLIILLINGAFRRDIRLFLFNNKVLIKQLTSPIILDSRKILGVFVPSIIVSVIDKLLPVKSVLLDHHPDVSIKFFEKYFKALLH